MLSRTSLRTSVVFCGSYLLVVKLEGCCVLTSEMHAHANVGRAVVDRPYAAFMEVSEKLQVVQYITGDLSGLPALGPVTVVLYHLCQNSVYN